GSMPFSPFTSTDIFPPGCQFPLGWSTPKTATTPWIIATDSASEGSCSFKSVPPGNSGKSQIQFTANFGAGNVIFDRRVSSEYFFDCLKFYIDGVQQHFPMNCATGGSGISGDAAWGSVMVPIASGLHTLLWSYEKDASVNIGAD